MLRKSMFVLVLALISTTALFSQQTNFKLLTHGVYDVGEKDGFTIDEWSVGIFTPSGGKALGVLGLRYQQKDWWVELNGGAIVDKNIATPLVDFRANYNWGVFSMGTNLQLIDPLNSSKILYVYVQGDWWIMPKRFALGLETENTFKNVGDDSVGIGSHVIVVAGKTSFMLAYQFREETGKTAEKFRKNRKSPNQIWIRETIHFDF